MEQYEELSGHVRALYGRVAELESDVATLKETSAPTAPPAPPKRDFTVVVAGDKANQVFESEGALLRLNPNFPRVAYGKDGHVMRRFGVPRDWNFIIPDERIWTS